MNTGRFYKPCCLLKQAPKVKKLFSYLFQLSVKSQFLINLIFFKVADKQESNKFLDYQIRNFVLSYVPLSFVNISLFSLT